jgi:AAA+ superfamily predicted ATPase
MSTSIEHTRPGSITRLSTWSELNRQWLIAAITRLRTRIEAQSAEATAAPGMTRDCIASHTAAGFTPALLHCAGAFGLSPFERELLLLVAGLELDHGLRSAVASFNSGGSALASYSLALATLTQPHWDALSPDAALRHWAIVNPEPGGILSQSALRIDERVLHFIAGVHASDAHLEAIATFIAPRTPVLDGDDLPIVPRIAALLAAGKDRGPLVALHGSEEDAASRRDLALAVTARLTAPALWISSRDLPGDAASLPRLARHIDREYLLSGAIPLLSIDNPADEAVAAGVVGRLHCPALWLGTPGRLLSTLPLGRRVVRLELPKPDARQSHAILFARWERLAPPELRQDATVKAALERTSAQFHLGVEALEHIVERMDAAPANARAPEIWAAAREASRGGLDALAQRIETRVTFDDLVLPPGQSAALRDIARQLRYRERVYREWEFGSKHQLGQGLVALFAGESGTGKTLAAEAIANEVNLDLYRVDLATLVSKYIGETEKNLKRLFDAAETSGAVLLFDEADALFGKRSEVKDSHDRYANIEVAYLLQRVEAYRGLAVLTTNMKSALDRAFLRRIRFVVTFPFPDMGARKQIWRKQFPAAAPLGEVDFAELARLNLAGGHIRSIVLSAAFKAADQDSVIDQALLMTAAHEEFAKLERNFSTTARRDT